VLRSLQLVEALLLVVLEANHDHRHIVKTLAVHAVLKHALDSEPALLVDGGGRPEVGVTLPLVLVAALPHARCDVFIGHFVEHTIARQHDEVMAGVDLEGSNIGLCLDHILVASSISELGFRISEGSRDRQTARQNSNGADDVFRLCFFLGLGLWCLLIVGSLSRRSLVDLATSRNDALVLFDVGRLVISAQSNRFLAAVD